MQTQACGASPSIAPAQPCRFAFILFAVGRFSGSAILRFAPAHRVLGLYAACNVLLMFLVFLGLGWLSMGALIASFFFMSIMYPTHFALAIRGLGERTKLASSWMVTAIVGGSIMPILMGWMADRYSCASDPRCACRSASTAIYAFSWRRLSDRDLSRPAASESRRQLSYPGTAQQGNGEPTPARDSATRRCSHMQFLLSDLVHLQGIRRSANIRTE